MLDCGRHQLLFVTQIEPRDLPKAHDTESVYGECEGEPLGEPGLLSKQPEVKESG